MREDVRKIGREVGSITLPQWVINIVLIIATSIITYAFTIGGVWAKFNVMANDMADIKIHLANVDQKIVDLQVSGGGQKIQTDYLKSQADSISRKQDEILNRLGK